MATPSEFLYPILYTIERTVVELKEEYKSLKDTEVERCYAKLKDYYRKKSFGKPCEEPESHSQKEQDLMDEILNSLDARVNENLDEQLLNSDHYTNGGIPFANFDQIYVVCFNNLAKSVKSWRKNKMGPSYLVHIRNHIVID